jgi:hypothetical protein
MQSTATSLTKGQRHTLLGYAAFLGVTAAAAVVWAVMRPWGETGGRSGYIAPITAVLAALGAFALVNVALGRIIADDSGLQTWRPLRRRAFAWAEIAAIELAANTERSGSVYRLVVVTRTGRRHVLPTPVSAWWGLNTDFGRTQQTLGERLAAAHGGGGTE